MNSIAVSICVPCYNQPHSLKRALDSIQSQTFTDFEVIITDDSTNDLCEEVYKAFATDKRFRYVHNKPGLGTPQNWNRGLDFVNSELIKFVHHDDYFADENSLARFMNAAQEHPEADFFFCSSFNCDEKGRLVNVNRAKVKWLKLLAKDPHVLLQGNYVGAPSATLYRARKGLKFDSLIKWLVDIDFYMAVLRANPRFHFIDEPLIKVTVGSATQVTAECVGNPDVEIREYLYVLDKYLRLGVRSKQIGFSYWLLFARFYIADVVDLSNIGILNVNRTVKRILALRRVFTLFDFIFMRLGQVLNPRFLLKAVMIRFGAFFLTSKE